MKSYGMNLTDDEILDNFIADAKNAEEMVSRYMRNDITDASGELTPDLLAEKCPDLRIIKISAPTFTTGKKNEVANTTIQQIYKNGRAKEDNWTATGSHKGQGTSSDHYGASARNIDINCKGGFTFGDDTTGDTYALTENSVPEKYFNIKVNVASSENANNSLLADEFNEFNPYVRQAKKDNPKVRDTMAFYPCVVFIQETDTTNATVFNDGQWHFYACGDIGNSKKNKDTMGMDPENHKEFIVEIDNNADEQTRFLSGDFSQETWDGDHSFEFRYSNPACTEEEIEAGKQAWITAQNWVVNADDEEFKAHFKDHFDLDIYVGVVTPTAEVTVSDDNKISVNVRVSTKGNNSITVEEDGLYVAVPDAYTKAEADEKIKSVADQLDAHAKDAVKHITAEERKAWNAKPTQDELAAAKAEAISAAAADATTKADAALSSAKTYANGLNTAMDSRVQVIEGAITWKSIDN